MPSTWHAPIRDVLASLLGPSLAEQRPQTHKRSCSPRVRAQWKSRALRTNLLISPMRPVTSPGSSRAQKGWYGSKRRRHIRCRLTKLCPQSIAELAIEFGWPNLHHHVRAA